MVAIEKRLSRLRHIACLSALIFALGLLGAQGVSAQSGPGCETLIEGAEGYTVCRIDPKNATIRVHLAGPDGAVYGGFDGLRRQLWAERRVLLIAMNGGMYHADRQPVGYHVEYGHVIKQGVTGGGYGNFHLLPNGIFSMRDGKAKVTETKAFLASGELPDFATQSGPMLVIDGKLHPRFLPDSDSYKIRNGVGVDKNGMVYLVMSRQPVQFYAFAKLFRDRLGCDNALYLDGTVSSLFDAAQNRRDRLFPMGPILSVSIPIPQGEAR